jgi:biopolymer transport protein ExbD
MGIKKRNKISAEFSMSSLTDIIFLLLIFFMLTSSMVQISVELPESNSQTVAPTDMAVMITLAGELTYNGKTIRQSDLSKLVSADIKKSENPENATLSIIAEKGVPWKKIAPLINTAKRLKIRAIMATKSRKK